MNQSAKDTALELVQKFAYLGIKWAQTEYYTLELDNAKECAILHCDLLLTELSKDEPSRFMNALEIGYYLEVKEEIIKL